MSIINNPAALYYNGELIGIITNPDPYADHAEICDSLSPDEGLADIVTIPTRGKSKSGHSFVELWDELTGILSVLGVEVTIEVDEDDED